MYRLSLVLLTAFLGACAPRVSTTPAGEVDVDVEPTGQEVEDWNATLTATPGHPGLSGSASANTGNGQTAVTVTLAGGTSGEAHPWHIHRGECGSNGPIVGDADAYPILQVGSNGQATASARITVELNEAEDYYVNVHHSTEMMGMIVACGELDD